MGCDIGGSTVDLHVFPLCVCSESSRYTEEEDPATRRRKKKSYYAKLNKLEAEKQKELAEKYRDRVSAA